MRSRGSCHYRGSVVDTWCKFTSTLVQRGSHGWNTHNRGQQLSSLVPIRSRPDRCRLQESLILSSGADVWQLHFLTRQGLDAHSVLCHSKPTIDLFSWSTLSPKLHLTIGAYQRSLLISYLCLGADVTIAFFLCTCNERVCLKTGLPASVPFR